MLETDFNFKSDIVSQATTEIINKISKQKEDIVNQKLIENGFPPLLEFLKKERFPRINMSKQGDWEYYFADNGTINGLFLVAFRIVYDNSFELKGNSCSASVTLHFQDKDCSSVLF